ncbi:MAG TPA: hypothetical protein VJX67_19570, partial [Blastocatellia bacterium]|nr:hypothetical protein [Blastocatellia bacterium]
DPHELQVLVAWLNQHRIDLSVLLRLHDANMRLALNVATRLESVVPPETSILWLPGECDAGAIPPELDERGLVWYPPGGGVRILCRTGAPE